MKKTFLIFSLLFALFLGGSYSASAQATYFNLNNASFTMQAPAVSALGAYSYVFPYFETLSPTKAALQIIDTLTISQQNSFVTYGTKLDTNLTLKLVIASDLKAGAMLYIITESDATARTTTFDSGSFLAVANQGTINKKKLYSFVYNGSKYVMINGILVN